METPAQPEQEFDFSVEKVEQAADLIQNPNENVQQAIAYIEQWESTPQSIFQACEVINTSQKISAHIFAALVLDHKIPYLWAQIDKEDRVKIRTFISQHIFTYTDNLLIVETLSRALAHIAVYDFPEEWGGYDAYLFPENESIITFLMLEAFFTDAEESQFITENRRQQLRNVLTRHVEFFLPRIQLAFTTPDIAPKALSTYYAMLNWTPVSAITIDFIRLIFTQFLVNKVTEQLSINCLKRIFLKRTDSSSIFDRFKYIVLELLATVNLPTGQSITNLPYLLRFVISLFYRFMMPIEKMVIESSNQKMQDHLMALITTILSVREDIPNKLWLLFYDIFKRIVDQNLNLMPLKYSMILFTPMLPVIIQNLYDMLPDSIDEDGILKIQAQNCFAKLVEVDYQAVQNFLEPQNPSASLSYALGCLISVRVPKEDMASFVQIVDSLFEVSNNMIESGDEGYIIALMFGFSRSASFLSTLGHFGKFLEIVILCLQNSSKLLNSAAAHALLYTAQNDPGLFLTDDTKIILINLIQMSEYFVLNLSETSAERMFECLLILIAKMNEPDKLGELFKPVVASILNPNSEQSVRTSLSIIQSLAKKKLTLQREPLIEYQYGKHFGPLVIEPTFQLAKVVVVQPQSNIEDLELLLRALSSIISCFDSYQEAEQPIKGVLALFFERKEILPCFFTFITHLRSKFFDMNELYQSVMESFVYPFIPPDGSFVLPNTPLAEILRMVTAFENTPISVEWIVKVGLGQGLISFEKEVNEAAALAVVRVFREMETNTLRQLFLEIGVDVFVAIFQALADSMHKPSTSALIKMFYQICLLIMNGVEFPDELRDFILKALEKVFVNNEEDLFGKFLNFIVISLTNQRGNGSDVKHFEDGVANFLIMQNKYSPGDASEFQTYKQPFYYLF